MLNINNLSHLAGIPVWITYFFNELHSVNLVITADQAINGMLINNNNDVILT